MALPDPRLRLGLGIGVRRLEGGLREEDPDRERGEGVNVDVLGGNAVSEGGVSSGDGFLGTGCDTKGIRILG